MEQFSVNGMWWLPGKESEQVSGLLEFDPKEASILNLNGSFKDFDQLGHSINHDIILGITSKGKLITLYRCFESSSNFSFPGYASTNYKVSIIFEGQHFETVESLAFERYSVSFSHLENWTRISGFAQEIEHNSENQLSKLTVTYNFPEEREIAVIGDVKIGFDYNLYNNVNLISGYKLTQTTYLKIEKNEDLITFDEFMSTYLYNLQNFLSLATGVTTFPLIIKCGKKSLDETIGDGRVRKNDVNILFPIRHYPQQVKEVHTHNMPLPYTFIKSELGDILNNWFTKSEILQPIYDLYFGTLYNSTMYLQHRFLSIVQAIESYHRRIYGGSYLEEEQYQDLLNKIKEIIKEELSGELKNTFIQKLSYLNELSLRSRLKELIDINKDFLEPIFEADKAFVDAVLNTRNYLTHFDERLTDKAKKGIDLYKIVEKLKFMLEICLMVEIGIPKEKIIQNITQSSKYDYLKTL